MKFQRSTVLLVATALLLGGVVLLTQARQSDPSRSTAEPTELETSPVFDFAEVDVVQLQIETTDQTVAFEKDDDGFWQMVEPDQQPAEEAAIAFLLSRLVTDGLLKTTTIETANQAEFGLDSPFATVNLTLQDGTEHTLILGDADFSGQTYYALIDPETFPLAEDSGEVEVAIVTQNIINGIDRPLDEWQIVTESAGPEETQPNAESSTDPEAPADAPDPADDTDSEVDGVETTPPDDPSDRSASPEDGSEDEASERSGRNAEKSAPDAENSDTTD